jgi:uncharacterized membrane protein YfhO
VRLTGHGPTRYEFSTDFAAPGWLFVADANYPGWTATIDGEPAPLLTAQLLGKAVAVDAGRHMVELRFRSRSLQTGLVLSSAGLGLLVLLLVLTRRPPGATREG